MRHPGAMPQPALSPQARVGGQRVVQPRWWGLPGMGRGAGARFISPVTYRLPDRSSKRAILDRSSSRAASVTSLRRWLSSRGSALSSSQGMP